MLHVSFFFLVLTNPSYMVAKATTEVYSVNGEGAILESTTRRWIFCFKSGNFKLKRWSRTDRQIELKEKGLKHLYSQKSLNGQIFREGER